MKRVPLSGLGRTIRNLPPIKEHLEQRQLERAVTRYNKKHDPAEALTRDEYKRLGLTGEVPSRVAPVDVMKAKQKSLEKTLEAAVEHAPRTDYWCFIDLERAEAAAANAWEFRAVAQEIADVRKYALSHGFFVDTKPEAEKAFAKFGWTKDILDYQAHCLGLSVHFKAQEEASWVGHEARMQLIDQRYERPVRQPAGERIRKELEPVWRLVEIAEGKAGVDTLLTNPVFDQHKAHVAAFLSGHGESGEKIVSTMRPYEAGMLRKLLTGKDFEGRVSDGPLTVGDRVEFRARGMDGRMVTGQGILAGVGADLCVLASATGSHQQAQPLVALAGSDLQIQSVLGKAVD